MSINVLRVNGMGWVILGGYWLSRVYHGVS